MGAYADENKGYRFLLTVIDQFSKFAWAVPLKNKTALTVVNAMETIFKEKRVPKNLYKQTMEKNSSINIFQS